MDAIEELRERLERTREKTETLLAPVPLRICDADVPRRTAAVYRERDADVARLDTNGKRPSTLLAWLSEVE